MRASSKSRLKDAGNEHRFGAPGAGKGAQAERISSMYGMVHLSTGEMLRSAISSGTDLGARAKETIDRGWFLTVIVKIVDARMDEGDCGKGVILDGFPELSLRLKRLMKFWLSRDRVLIM